MAIFSDEQTMLCLAALCYRGFTSGTVSRFHVDTIRRAIADGLDTLEPLRGQWELVWGPSVYRSPVSLLDDELMYVVRRRQGPARYVVAIRGTNPVSTFDWLFGDFWTCQSTPWPYTTDGSAISLSTALGLAVLQRLRSEDVSGIVPVAPLSVGLGLATVGEVVKRAVTGLADAARSAIEPLRPQLVALIGSLARRASDGQERDAESHIEAVAASWRSAELKLLIDLLEKTRLLAGPRLDLAVLSLLEDDARFRASVGTGMELLPFLTAVVAREKGPIDVVVTGHSKGGALAPTVALWLAETQGANAPEDERWDPQSRATVHCFSYAGPTAGNAPFAKRSDLKIGARCHRFANPFDIVPHAWASSDLQKLPTLYDGVVARSNAMAGLVTTIDALTHRLGYTQIGTLTQVPASLAGFPGLDRAQRLFFDQFVYQHMEAYLQAFKLGITTLTFFDPLAGLPR